MEQHASSNTNRSFFCLKLSSHSLYLNKNTNLVLISGCSLDLHDFNFLLFFRDQLAPLNDNSLTMPEKACLYRTISAMTVFIYHTILGHTRVSSITMALTEDGQRTD